jgi:hypothetical protein
MDELILDIAIQIAVINPDAWFILTRINDEFARYSRTTHAIKEYIRLFTRRERVDIMTQTILFDRLHSIYDEPSITYHKYQIKIWYINGLISRYCDLPAYIRCGYIEWRLNGLVHRDGDKSAVIDKGANCEKWFTNGKLHRGNDLPTVVHYSGGATWFLNDRYVKIEQYGDIVNAQID